MAATLSADEIAMDVMDSFKKQFPMLQNMSTDFGPQQFVKGQTITARRRVLPTVRDYDATSGYKANATSANDLVVDVPVTLDRHKHVPVKVDYIDGISTKRDLYSEAIADLAYSLGKEAIDYVLGLCVAANISSQVIEAAADVDLDTLRKVNKELNENGASPSGRFGIVNSAFADSLDTDTRIASRDYHSQRRAANAYMQLANIQGFGALYEYPDLPANSENMSAVFGTSEAFLFVSRLPKASVLERPDFPKIAEMTPITDPDTGLTMLLIKWVDAGTFDAYFTITWLYGAAVGAQGGTAGDKTDYAGVRVITSQAV